MKTKILCLLLLSLILLTSCNFFGNHLHDGEYSTNALLVGDVHWKVNGNEIIVGSSLLGDTKIKCKQYSDRIEYTDTKGVSKIAYVMENGDLKLNDLVILKKEQSSNSNNPSTEEETISTSKNQTQNFNLSTDAYSQESAIVKDIIVEESDVYIVVDVIQIKFLDTDDGSVDYEVINQNPKLRTYRASSNLIVRDSQCNKSTTSKYLIDNKNKIIESKDRSISPLALV